MAVEGPKFTRQMRETHTILVPSMANIQFALLEKVLKHQGYNVKLLTNEGSQVIHKGLKFVHNDTCYPALLVIGQLIDALDSNSYDLTKIALAISQTGGGCRASNYIYLLRKALDQAGYENVPIVSLNLAGMNKEEGFQITLSMLVQGIYSLALGDTLMYLKNQVQPYLVNKKEAHNLVTKWIEKLGSEKRQTFRSYKKHTSQMVKEFSELKVDYSRHVIKVGVVGEIYMKYAPLGNNHLEDFLEQQECEVMIPGILGFVMYGIYNQVENINLYGGSFIKKLFFKWVLKYLLKREAIFLKAASTNENFVVPKPFTHTIKTGREMINLGTKMGEGWLLTAEMADLAALGYKNIICVQPFGCLPNHIVGKGMIAKMKERDQSANIVPIDYDPGATRVNQENRIKLMLAVANETN